MDDAMVIFSRARGGEMCVCVCVAVTGGGRWTCCVNVLGYGGNHGVLSGLNVHTQREIADLKLLSAVYTIDNEGLEKDGAVVGFASEFVNHACVSPDGLTFVYVTRRVGVGVGG